ncbi:MAG: hypothetical protein HY327_13300, partial [Chloroflexi bacterium]|nr:hypothetical protein [Chloroflexota bacterium]
MSHRLRLGLALASVAAYALAFAPLYAVTRTVAGALTFLPIGIIGGLFGLRAGILFGLL